MLYYCIFDKHFYLFNLLPEWVILVSLNQYLFLFGLIFLIIVYICLVVFVADMLNADVKMLEFIYIRALCINGLLFLIIFCCFNDFFYQLLSSFDIYYESLLGFVVTEPAFNETWCWHMYDYIHLRFFFAFIIILCYIYWYLLYKLVIGVDCCCCINTIFGTSSLEFLGGLTVFSFISVIILILLNVIFFFFGQVFFLVKISFILRYCFVFMYCMLVTLFAYLVYSWIYYYLPEYAIRYIAGRVVPVFFITFVCLMLILIFITSVYNDMLHGVIVLAITINAYTFLFKAILNFICIFFICIVALYISYCIFVFLYRNSWFSIIQQYPALIISVWMIVLCCLCCFTIYIKHKYLRYIIVSELFDFASSSTCIYFWLFLLVMSICLLAFGLLAVYLFWERFNLFSYNTIKDLIYILFISFVLLVANIFLNLCICVVNLLLRYKHIFYTRSEIILLLYKNRWYAYIFFLFIIANYITFLFILLF
jgi:hypothetical protein